MPLVKRYANRKLYDSETRRYITLEELAESIRRGEDVRVVDHVSGEDLTSATLLQIIFEEEKKIGGLLPQVFMTRLICAGGGAANALRNRLAAIDPFQMVDEEIRRRLQLLTDQGRISEEEAQRMRELLLRRGAPEEGVRIAVQDESAPVAEEPPLPAEALADPAELDALLRQVELLERELENLRAASR
jgi:polyhydroxyalkanoate synthesis repressor PhaR